MHRVIQEKGSSIPIMAPATSLLLERLTDASFGLKQSGVSTDPTNINDCKLCDVFLPKTSIHKEKSCYCRTFPFSGQYCNSRWHALLFWKRSTQVHRQGSTNLHFLSITMFYGPFSAFFWCPQASDVYTLALVHFALSTTVRPFLCLSFLPSPSWWKSTKRTWWTTLHAGNTVVPKLWYWLLGYFVWIGRIYSCLYSVYFAKNGCWSQGHSIRGLAIKSGIRLSIPRDFPIPGGTSKANPPFPTAGSNAFQVVHKSRHLKRSSDLYHRC